MQFLNFASVWSKDTHLEASSNDGTTYNWLGESVIKKKREREKWPTPQELQTRRSGEETAKGNQKLGGWDFMRVTRRGRWGRKESTKPMLMRGQIKCNWRLVPGIWLPEIWWHRWEQFSLSGGSTRWIRMEKKKKSMKGKWERKTI